jgi:hypothetical protein
LIKNKKDNLQGGRFIASVMHLPAGGVGALSPKLVSCVVG